VLNKEQEYEDKMVVAMLRLDLLAAEESLDVAMFSNGIISMLRVAACYLLRFAKFSIDSYALSMLPHQPSTRK